jgi:hypothetical protein
MNNTGMLMMLLIVGVGFSCKKDKPKPPKNGIFRGVFMEMGIESDTISEGIAYLAIYDQDSSFTLQGDESSGVPVSCNGVYGLLGPNQIEFINKAPIDELDDPYYILDTLFEYEYSDSIFNITLETETRRYVYNLERY